MLKKFCSIMLILIMVFSLTACGGDNKETQGQTDAGTKAPQTQGGEESTSGETQAPEREHVVLSLYTFSSAAGQIGEKETFEALNKYLKEKLNTTVEFHIYKTADYKSTMPTKVSSGAEDMDIIFTRRNNLDFLTFANMNAFAPIEDYKDEYLTGTKEIAAEAAWDALTVNGHLYAVPTPRDSATRYNIMLNTTMMEDLGLTFDEKGYHTYWDVLDFAYEGKTARDKKYPDKANQPILRGLPKDLSGWYNVEALGGNYVYANVPGLSGFEGMGDGEKAFCPYLTDDYREWAKMLVKSVKDGITPFDAKSYDSDKTLYSAGEFLFDSSVGTVFINEDANMPYFKTKLVVAQDSVHATSGLTCGYAVSAKSKNVERALEVIDLLNSDEYLATVLHFGPEGIGWTDEDNDGMIELTTLNSDSSNRYWYQWYQWQLGGLTATKVPPASTLNFTDLLTAMNTNATPAANLEFVFNTEPVQNEIAACNNVISEYHTGILVLGQQENVDQLCDEFAKKLKDNGIEKIVAECQKQLDEWRAANKKEVVLMRMISVTWERGNSLPFS